MSDGGKGSKPRPYSVSAETFNSNWDRIFLKKSIELGMPNKGDQMISNSGEVLEYDGQYWIVTTNSDK
jgi:hypothetical protein